MPNNDLNLYFSDVFEVSKKSLDDYGAFNVSLVTDLPLFIDPFLLFQSPKKEYQDLHKSILSYLAFLRDKSISQDINQGLLHAWFYFSEVEQNWLGFTLQGNRGRGLGRDFAVALNSNLAKIFASFGREQITKSAHLEKLCLIKSGVGRDTISDFTTNLIKEYLLIYTQSFALKNIDQKHLKTVPIRKVRFNFNTERWESGDFTLPYHRHDYVILTPKDILTRDDVWINRTDYLTDFDQMLESSSDQQIRAELDNYLKSELSKEPKKEEYNKALTDFTFKHPELIDYYIKYKEDNGDKAVERSYIKVADSKLVYVEQFGGLVHFLRDTTAFYQIAGNTAKEAYDRIMFLKDVIENKGGWKYLYKDDKPIAKEEDTHILYRLTWYGTLSDVSREVNDGRGPADFKISRGATDKTIVEFKLASNPQLKKNLSSQVEIYKAASDAGNGYKVIFFFNDSELKKVQDILQELALATERNIVLIDARKKLSASRAG
ncbi:MAG: hypothetical protein QQM50_07915 [Dehalococcoides mccartyi]|uniref:hypothetical protein n=1 Tax=Dehalococcoides TaxID=61434 RepID=UPI0027378D38|nr:hypothetical protein [Dehalococcoides mccartyi]MDP4280451.1 hypothetical protein [Dehalococcoides mccartyi]